MDYIPDVIFNPTYINTIHFENSNKRVIFLIMHVSYFNMDSIQTVRIPLDCIPTLKTDLLLGKEDIRLFRDIYVIEREFLLI